MNKKFVSAFVAALFAGALSTGALAAADVDAAKAAAKQNNCMKCHGLDKDKDGPSFKKTAAKYKGKADAESKLFTHLTTAPKVKLSDGTEEEHKKIKATEAETKNLIQYILEQ
jgi:cytochrome c